MRSLNLFISCFLLSIQTGYAKPTFQKDKLSFKIPTKNLDQLCLVAKSTLNYLNQGQKYDPKAIHSRLLNSYGVSLEDTKATLQSVCQPKLNGSVDQNFRALRWLPDKQHAQTFAEKKPLLQRLPQDKLLMTKYYVRKINAQPQASQSHSFALYGLPFDETSLSIQEASLQPTLTRYRYGKQKILSGFLHQQKLAPALVWVNRSDLEAALLQGTAVATLNQRNRIFNVHRNNNIAYDRTIKPEQQERYWYFREVSHIQGYGKDAGLKVNIIPQVTIAGDVYQLGLGKVMLLEYKLGQQTKRELVVMADTGGAFEDNLYQIDYLSGYYANWDEYYAANKHLPDYVKAWILVKK